MSGEPLRDRLDLETFLATMRARSRKERAEARVEAFEEELARERASAFGRANEKVVQALAALEVAERDLAADPSTRDDYVIAWQAARRARWELRVHREALGLPWTRDEERRYPLPRLIRAG